jgi:hypothetical protein
LESRVTGVTVRFRFDDSIGIVARCATLAPTAGWETTKARGSCRAAGLVDPVSDGGRDRD